MKKFEIPKMTKHLEDIIERNLVVDFSEDDIELLKRAELVTKQFNASSYRTYKRLDKFNEFLTSLKSSINFLEQYVDNPIELSTIPIHPDQFKKYVRSKIQNVDAYKAYYDQKRAREIDENELEEQEEEKRYNDPVYYLSEQELEEYFSKR